MLTVTNVLPGTVEVLVIGKCPVKGCRNRRRNAMEGRIKTDRLRTWTSWSIPTEYEPRNPYIGWDWGSVSATLSRVFAHGDPCEVEPDGPRMAHLGRRIIADAEAMYALGWVCEDHDRFMRITAVKGVVNADRGCDGRCEAATGPSCECSCGGRNHGAVHDFRS